MAKSAVIVLVIWKDVLITEVNLESGNAGSLPGFETSRLTGNSEVPHPGFRRNDSDSKKQPLADSFQPRFALSECSYYNDRVQALAAIEV